MALAKRTRFILIQSTRNANVTEDNMEPYHISIFRRSASMPPLPRITSSVNFNRQESEAEQQTLSLTPIVISKSQQNEKNSINKFNKLNLQTMKKKSARFSRRLSSAFGLTAQTIDEEFNFQEQRFRSIEKFLKIFQRNIYLCIEALRESFLTQIDIAEDFQELLIDKIPDLPQQFVRSKHSFLENAFTEYCNHIEIYVVNSINTLVKLFISPANLISKRHKKLLDYDNAQSAYEKVKHEQLNQTKQVLDISKRTYESLNNQLLEELPVLYQCTCQILSICLKKFLYAHMKLMQQMRINIQIILNQTISSIPIEQLNWQQIAQRFTMKNSPANEQLLQLTITAKNFSERLKKQANNLYNYDKNGYMQTDDIRYLLKNRYAEKDLFTVIQDYPISTDNRLINSRSDITVRNGDLVGIIQQQDGDNSDSNWLVDNGFTRGYLPRSILIPLSSDHVSSTPPPPPIRRDISIPTRAPLPLPRTTSKPSHIQSGTNSKPLLINSARYVDEENERVYFNLLDCQTSGVDITESHQYATIDTDHDVTPVQSNEQTHVYIALYDFNSSIDGVLSLTVGDQLKILRQVDDDGNEEWWYVEKLNDTKQKGYVPANYIQSVQ